MYLNDVVIILQGPAYNKEQLLKILNEYKQMGFNNIVVSTYSSFDDAKITYPKIMNDLVGKNEILAPVRKQNSVMIRYDDEDVMENIRTDHSLFWHMLTTRRGLKLAQEYHPEAKYYLKLRADMFFENMGERIQNWLNKYEKLNLTSDKKQPFIGKITCSRYVKPDWYLTDYLAFGLREDIEKYYSFKLCRKRDKNGKFCSEKIISSSYLNEYDPELTWNEAKDYFLKIHRLNSSGINTTDMPNQSSTPI